MASWRVQAQRVGHAGQLAGRQRRTETVLAAQIRQTAASPAKQQEGRLRQRYWLPALRIMRRPVKDKLVPCIMHFKSSHLLAPLLTASNMYRTTPALQRSHAGPYVAAVPFLQQLPPVRLRLRLPLSTSGAMYSTCPQQQSV